MGSTTLDYEELLNLYEPSNTQILYVDFFKIWPFWVQGGPLLVINGVITLINGLING